LRERRVELQQESKLSKSSENPSKLNLNPIENFQIKIPNTFRETTPVLGFIAGSARKRNDME
jgi:hypothetical protein